MTRSLAFFGAFNPPTRAHIELAEYSMRETGAEEVIFVPSKSDYILDFQKKGFAFSDEDRINMLRQIADNRPWMRYTDIEMKQAEQPRTYDTLCRMREMGEHPSLLLGADKLPELEDLWHNVREMAAEFGIVCMDRGDMNCEDEIRKSPFLASLNLRIVHVPDRYRNISSTRVRAMLSQLYDMKEELHLLLPDELTELPSELLRP